MKKMENFSSGDLYLRRVNIEPSRETYDDPNDPLIIIDSKDFVTDRQKQIILISI